MRRIHGLACVVCAALTEVGAEVGGAGADAAAALTATVKPRNPSVSAIEFVTKLKEACSRQPEDIPTAAQLAEEMGMNVGSFNQRLNQLRNDWKELVTAKHPKAVTADGKAKPFPFVLTDGRRSEGGEKASTNAILAALMDI